MQPTILVHRMIGCISNYAYYIFLFYSTTNV